MADVNILLAFGAGFLSFISPCCLPLYPAFLSYITGVSVSDIKTEKVMLEKRAMLHTLFFLIGFSSIFIVLGMSTSYIGQFLTLYDDLIRQVGAIGIIFFGFVVIGVFTPEFLMKDRKITFKNRPSGFIGSIIIGMGFAAGWTPCTGPILATVIALSVSNPGSGLMYMVAYTLGFAIPFFILSFFITKLQWIKRHNVKIIKIGGYVMIVMGIFLFFDWLTKITSYLVNIFGGFTGF